MTDPFTSRALGKASTALVCIFSISLAVESLAQGQDSTPWSRDLQVIEVMLPGLYSNANQAYFDGRRQISSPQPRHDLFIEAIDDGFVATLSAPEGAVTATQRWSLVADDERQAVPMNISSSDGDALCPVWWAR